MDWSNGGDGIVVRATVKTVADLRGKTCVLAQNSPSHFFLLNALINGGVQPSEVTMKFTGDAFQAAAAFNADRVSGPPWRLGQSMTTASACRPVRGSTGAARP